MPSERWQDCDIEDVVVALSFAELADVSAQGDALLIERADGSLFKIAPPDSLNTSGAISSARGLVCARRDAALPSQREAPESADRVEETRDYGAMEDLGPEYGGRIGEPPA